MAKTRSMTRNQNHYDDASIRKRIKIGDSCGVAPWSDLNHDVLFLVMMQLGVIDFLSFGGVCKSWRSLALSNKTMFMATKPPMFIRLSPRAHKDACYLIDFKGRKFKTIIHRLVGRTCFGSTCGYLILYGSKERDIWLVNPITRHELHFPDVPLFGYSHPGDIRGILVFSPSISEWVFVTIKRFHREIWFSIAGKGAWTSVFAGSRIFDLHAFKGNVYILHRPWQMKLLRLNPEPKLTFLKTKNSPKTFFPRDFVCSSKNLYLMGYDSEENAFFLTNLNHHAAVKQEPWADPCSQCRIYVDYKKSRKGRLFTSNMWYFPHECLNVNCID